MLEAKQLSDLARDSTAPQAVRAFLMNVMTTKNNIFQLLKQGNELIEDAEENEWLFPYGRLRKHLIAFYSSSRWPHNQVIEANKELYDEATDLLRLAIEYNLPQEKYLDIAGALAGALTIGIEGRPANQMVGDRSNEVATMKGLKADDEEAKEEGWLNEEG